MKVIIGPMNIASQPYYLARGLRRHGVDATCIAFGRGDSGHRFGYKHDWAVDITARNGIERARIFSDLIKESLRKNYDIYHFFQRSFFMGNPPRKHDKLTGFDIPLLKARGKHIGYRFTGWELIDREIELKNNQYSAFRHGWDGHFDVHLKREYLEFLKCYVDSFMVVDPMMQEHMPEAHIVPRLLNVDDFEEVGIKKVAKPLILHAPSNKVYKGTRFILAALRKLKDEGLDFELKLLKGEPFNKAVEWYKRADIIIDQALIGWYGVLAMECMAMGKPVAVYMREDLANTPDEIPIQNMNLDNLEDKIRELILDYDSREKLAVRGRQYVREHHDESVVIPKLLEVYRGMIENVTDVSESFADVDFLLEQRILIEQQEALIKKLEFQLGQRIVSPGFEGFAKETVKTILNWLPSSIGNSLHNWGRNILRYLRRFQSGKTL